MACPNDNHNTNDISEEWANAVENGDSPPPPGLDVRDLTDQQLQHLRDSLDGIESYAQSFANAGDYIDSVAGAAGKAAGMAVGIATANPWIAILVGSVVTYAVRGIAQGVTGSSDEWLRYAEQIKRQIDDEIDNRDRDPSEYDDDPNFNGDPDDDTSNPNDNRDPTGGDDDCDLPVAGAFLSSPLSPLVIDLDGDGIELTPLSGSTTFFDLNVDGFAELTGWVHSDDGLLALDVNGNGYIDDNSELFGNTTGFSDGFAQLAQLDTNTDGIIDANDASFVDLVVWRDLDQDGVSDAGELQSLNDVVISSIDLNANEVDETNQEHLVTHRSNVVFSDGGSGLIEDIHFQNDPRNAQALLPDDFEYHPDAAKMPALWGYGQIASTWVAFSMDDALRAQASSLLDLLSDGNVEAFVSGFSDFLYAWVGADNVDPSSRGAHIDARKLVFLEKAYGSSFVGQLGETDPGHNAGREIGEFFDELAQKLAGRFMAQAAVSSTLLATDNYEEFRDELESHPLSWLAVLVQNYSPVSRSLDGDLSEVLSGLQDEIDNGALTSENALAAIMLLEHDFSSSSEEFDQLIQAAIVQANLDSSSEIALDLKYAVGRNVVHTTDDHDTVDGSHEEDYFRGQAGNDTLKGGDGADTYVYSLGDGNDTIDDVSYITYRTDNDRLVFTDQNAGDVTFSRNAGDDLVITLSNGETVKVTDHFRNVYADMELIEFADGTVLDVAGIAQKSINDQNGDGDDVVLGSNGHDTFLGGVGNDTLKGGDGADTYVYSLGDGNDTIDDVSYITYRTDNDRLVFTDQNAGDVTFSRNAGDDLVITLSNGETVKVTDHFRSGSFDMELIAFADGTVLDVAGIAAKVINDQNGDGDDVVLGSNGNDTFLGGVGNDTLKGGDGADTYVYSLGDGNDTIDDVSYITYRTDNDRLVFTDQNAGDVTFSRNAGDDLVITLSNGETVKVTDHFRNVYADMELIEFADGTVLDVAGIAQKSINDQNGDGDDVVLGSNGHDTFLGGVGNDTLKGGDGADTYVYSLGDGNDTIDDVSYITYRTDNDRLVFTDQNAGDVTFSRNAGDDLVITLSNGETVKVTDHFRNVYADMELIEFADGTVLDVAGIAQKSINDQNGDGDDVVLGSNGHDTFLGGVGNDTLKGGDGADTYVYSLGDGNDTIDDVSYITYRTDNDRLVFTDQNAGDVTFSRNAGDDLVITLSNGETVKVTDHFRNVYADMELIEFADGTVLDVAGIAQKSLLGSAGNDTILGFSSNDSIEGRGGDDVLTGGTGADVFVFNSLVSEGADTITDFELNADTIQLAGTTYADLTLVDTESGTRVEWGNGSVELYNIAIASVTEDQFSFV